MSCDARSRCPGSRDARSRCSGLQIFYTLATLVDNSKNRYCSCFSCAIFTKNACSTHILSVKCMCTEECPYKIQLENQSKNRGETIADSMFLPLTLEPHYKDPSWMGSRSLTYPGKLWWVIRDWRMLSCMFEFQLVWRFDNTAIIL